MTRELCFKIENYNLYLEQVLVDYMDIPILFLCKDNKQYFLILCSDFDEFNYIVVKLTTDDIYELLHGYIPMRDVFLKQENYWSVKSGDDVYRDQVNKKNISELDITVLPDENACFKALTDATITYVRNFDNEFFSDELFQESEEKIDLENWDGEREFNLSISEIKQFNEVLDYELKINSNCSIIDYKEFSSQSIASVASVKKIEDNIFNDCIDITESNFYTNVIANAA